MKPDIMAVAKALACGVPVGAFLTDAEGGCDQSLAPGVSRNNLWRKSFRGAVVSTVFDIFEKEKINGACSVRLHRIWRKNLGTPAMAEILIFISPQGVEWDSSRDLR
ncbi:MAG: hypothetical protein V8R80_12095 [Eubacterium sp.]